MVFYTNNHPLHKDLSHMRSESFTNLQVEVNLEGILISIHLQNIRGRFTPENSELPNLGFFGHMYSSGYGFSAMKQTLNLVRKQLFALIIFILFTL